jgi:biopolymer transport protein ExbD
MSGIKRKKIAEEEEELNLTPFLDVMITLIPFLMLTASFFSVVVLEAKLPTPIPPDKMQEVKMPPPFDLVVMVPKDSIKIYVNNKDPLGPPQYAVDAVDRKDSTSFTDEQLKSFHNILVEIKKKFPTEERMALDPHPALPLEKLSEILDQSKTFTSTDAAINENPEFKANMRLFPGIAMKGVYVP